MSHSTYIHLHPNGSQLKQKDDAGGYVIMSRMRVENLCKFVRCSKCRSPGKLLLMGESEENPDCFITVPFISPKTFFVDNGLVIHCSNDDCKSVLYQRKTSPSTSTNESLSSNFPTNKVNANINGASTSNSVLEKVNGNFNGASTSSVSRTNVDHNCGASALPVGPQQIKCNSIQTKPYLRPKPSSLPLISRVVPPVHGLTNVNSQINNEMPVVISNGSSASPTLIARSNLPGIDVNSRNFSNVPQRAPAYICISNDNTATQVNDGKPTVEGDPGGLSRVVYPQGSIPLLNNIPIIASLSSVQPGVNPLNSSNDPIAIIRRNPNTSYPGSNIIPVSESYLKTVETADTFNGSIQSKINPSKHWIIQTNGKKTFTQTDPNLGLKVVPDKESPTSSQMADTTKSSAQAQINPSKPWIIKVITKKPTSNPPQLGIVPNTNSSHESQSLQNVNNTKSSAQSQIPRSYWSKTYSSIQSEIDSANIPNNSVNLNQSSFSSKIADATKSFVPSQINPSTLSIVQSGLQKFTKTQYASKVLVNSAPTGALLPGSRLVKRVTRSESSSDKPSTLLKFASPINNMGEVSSQTFNIPAMENIDSMIVQKTHSSVNKTKANLEENAHDLIDNPYNAGKRAAKMATQLTSDTKFKSKTNNFVKKIPPSALQHCFQNSMVEKFTTLNRVQRMNNVKLLQRKNSSQGMDILHENDGASSSLDDSQNIVGKSIRNDLTEPGEISENKETIFVAMPICEEDLGNQSKQQMELDTCKDAYNNCCQIKEDIDDEIDIYKKEFRGGVDISEKEEIDVCKEESEFDETMDVSDYSANENVTDDSAKTFTNHSVNENACSEMIVNGLSVDHGIQYELVDPAMNIDDVIDNDID